MRLQQGSKCIGVEVYGGGSSCVNSWTHGPGGLSRPQHAQDRQHSGAAPWDTDCQTVKGLQLLCDGGGASSTFLSQPCVNAGEAPLQDPARLCVSCPLDCCRQCCGMTETSSRAGAPCPMPCNSCQCFKVGSVSGIRPVPVQSLRAKALRKHSPCSAGSIQAHEPPRCLLLSPCADGLLLQDDLCVPICHLRCSKQVSHWCILLQDHLCMFTCLD